MGIQGLIYYINGHGVGQPIDLSTLPPASDGTSLFNRANPTSCDDVAVADYAAASFDPCQHARGQECTLNTATYPQLFRGQQSLGFNWDQIDPNPSYLVLDGTILDMGVYLRYTSQSPPPTSDTLHAIIVSGLSGQDITRALSAIPSADAVMPCLKDKYRVGVLDKLSVGCFTAQIVNWVSLVLILLIVFVRFSMAVLFDWILSFQLVRTPKRTNKKLLSPEVPPAQSGRRQRFPAQPVTLPADQGPPVGVCN